MLLNNLRKYHVLFLCGCFFSVLEVNLWAQEAPGEKKPEKDTERLRLKKRVAFDFSNAELGIPCPERSSFFFGWGSEEDKWALREMKIDQEKFEKIKVSDLWFSSFEGCAVSPKGNFFASFAGEKGSRGQLHVESKKEGKSEKMTFSPGYRLEAALCFSPKGDTIYAFISERQVDGGSRFIYYSPEKKTQESVSFDLEKEMGKNCGGARKIICDSQENYLVAIGQSFFCFDIQKKKILWASDPLGHGGGIRRPDFALFKASETVFVAGHQEYQNDRQEILNYGFVSEYDIKTGKELWTKNYKEEKNFKYVSNLALCDSEFLVVSGCATDAYTLVQSDWKEKSECKFGVVDVIDLKTLKTVQRVDIGGKYV